MAHIENPTQVVFDQNLIFNLVDELGEEPIIVGADQAVGGAAAVDQQQPIFFQVCQRYKTCFLCQQVWLVSRCVLPGNTKWGNITVLLTYCLTGLD